jgi:hypothetical protein
MVVTSRQASHDLAETAGIRRDHAALLEACPGGVLVIRLARCEEPAPGDSWEQRAEAFRVQPHLGFAAWLEVCAHLAVHGRLAMAVTVGDRPVLLADLVSFRGGGELVELGLEPPGEWGGLLAGRRLVTGPGPRWLMLGGRQSPACAARGGDRREPVGAGRSTTWSRWA